MSYAESKRMPVDERKVKDMLRNQHIFRDKMNVEIGTYQKAEDNPQISNGVLTYLNEAAYGEMKDLINDVGINRDTIPFYNLASMTKMTTKNQSYDTDRKFNYLMNAMFTPLDMTDHEDSFVGWNEVGGELPLNRISWLSPLMPEPHPQSNQLVGIEELEERPIRMTSQTLQGIMFARAHPPDPEDPEEDDYDDEEGGDSEGGDEEGEGEGEEAEYGEYDEEDAGDVWPPPDKIPHTNVEDRFFVAPKNHRQNLRENYSDVEIGAFMKLLNVRPKAQWEDQSTYHYKLGVHTYEDEAQEMDPTFHILSEAERVEAERLKTREWRSGHEVRFETPTKKPLRYDYRF